MPKWAVNAIKGLVVLAGFAFVLSTLSWQDRVELPAGFVWPDGGTIDEPLVVAVHEAPSDEWSDGQRLSVWRPTDEDGSTSGWGVKEPGGAAVEIGMSSLRRFGGEATYRPGILRLLGSMPMDAAGVGLAVLGLGFGTTCLRWWVLIASRLPVTLFRATRLTFLGMFFNLMMPGMTGGDLVRAYYAARGTRRRGVAILSLVMDRVAGMVGLLLVLALVSLSGLDDPLLRTVAVLAWGALLALVVVAGLYTSPTIRRTLAHRLCARAKGDGGQAGADPGRIGRLLGTIDEAVVGYRRHPAAVAGAVLLGLMNHTLIVCCLIVTARGLGIELPVMTLAVLFPVVLAVGSLPISFMGLGTMEAAGWALLSSAGEVTFNQVVGVLLMLRLYLVAWGLVGGLAMLGGGISLHDVRAAEQESEGAADRTASRPSAAEPAREPRSRSASAAQALTD